LAAGAEIFTTLQMGKVFLLPNRAGFLFVALPHLCPCSVYAERTKFHRERVLTKQNKASFI
jgi:hypothetical protein